MISSATAFLVIERSMACFSIYLWASGSDMPSTEIRIHFEEMHGKYPFPEATATTQILVSGEGGKGAGTLLVSGLIGGLYDFLVSTFGTWSDTISTTVMGIGRTVADKAKVLLKINTSAAVLGLGYIIGLKYAFVICCGSLLVWLVIIPLK